MLFSIHRRYTQERGGEEEEEKRQLKTERRWRRRQRGSCRVQYLTLKHKRYTRD